MSLEVRILEDVHPLYQYANSSNPSKIIDAWVLDGNVRIRRIYENCVGCNATRFSLKDIFVHKLGCIKSTYHCDECAQKVKKILDKYGTDAEASHIFWSFSSYFRLNSKL